MYWHFVFLAGTGRRCSNGLSDGGATSLSSIRAPLREVAFRISLYWPSGYLCAQLTNETTEKIRDLEAGIGTIEFHCPVLPVVPGLYRIDVELEANGKEIDLRQRCATLCVETGKGASGDFYIDNTWGVQVEPTATQESGKKRQA